jgi:hypothetical protein
MAANTTLYYAPENGLIHRELMKSFARLTLPCYAMPQSTFCVPVRLKGFRQSLPRKATECSAEHHPIVRPLSAYPLNGYRSSVQRYPSGRRHFVHDNSDAVLSNANCLQTCSFCGGRFHSVRAWASHIGTHAWAKNHSALLCQLKDRGQLLRQLRSVNRQRPVLPKQHKYQWRVRKPPPRSRPVSPHQECRLQQQRHVTHERAQPSLPDLNMDATSSAEEDNHDLVLGLVTHVCTDLCSHLPISPHSVRLYRRVRYHPSRPADCCCQGCAPFNTIYLHPI